MTTGRTGKFLRHLRRSALLRDGAGLSDAHLLGLFAERGDESAFEALVRRHGAMVLGMCRRVLGDAHDAEDAFQATFLVLARKAASITEREALANWLYGVAFQTARKAKALSARRREGSGRWTRCPNARRRRNASRGTTCVRCSTKS